MMSVFLSHNSEDKPFVRRLASHLAKIGIYVWTDDAQLNPGDSLIGKIGKAIADVDYVVSVISQKSVLSSWVQTELQLAMTDEIHGKRIKVIPVMIEQCEVPSFLRHKLYADFSKNNSFKKQFEKLLKGVGLAGAITVTWTVEGPQILGDRVIISATEGSALLDRWQDVLPKFVKQESEKYHGDFAEYWPRASFLATIRACADTYRHIPSEEAIFELRTELARKFNLFYRFILDMEVEAAAADGEPRIKGIPKWDMKDMVGRTNHKRQAADLLAWEWPNSVTKL